MLSTENNNKDMIKMIDMTKKKRVVVKVGTSTLTHSTGLLNIRRVEQLVKTLADLQNAGHEIILVSSGAVGLGRAKLGIKERPKDTPTRQACAAVGQCELMYLYDNLFSEYSLNVAQLLLTKYILLEDRRINVQNALNRIIELGSIPIVNENDTVSIDELELEMGENDSLAANVAVLANADLLIIMSDIEGLFDKDPHKYDDAELIPVVPEITEEIKAIAGGAGSSLGTGGVQARPFRKQYRELFRPKLSHSYRQLRLLLSSRAVLQPRPLRKGNARRGGYRHNRQEGNRGDLRYLWQYHAWYRNGKAVRQRLLRILRPLYLHHSKGWKVFQILYRLHKH